MHNCHRCLGEYAPLVKYFQKNEYIVEIIFPSDNTSYQLKSGKLKIVVCENCFQWLEENLK